MNQNDEILNRLKAVECPDSTYPAKDPALVFERGVGEYVYDVEGREYLDLCAGFGALPFGHNATYLTEWLANRGDRVMHGMGDVYASRAKVDLLGKLLGMAPSHLERGALALTGAQAVEIALKTALLKTGRFGFLALADGYHGLDLGVLPLTAREDFRAPFAGWLKGDCVERLPVPFTERDIGQALERLRARGLGLAGIIAEPVQGRAGFRPLGLPALELLRQAAKASDALLIYDEVFSGLGRSGRLWFADQVPCDLLCLGKSLGGGFPMSACLGTREAFGGWPESTGEAIHTGTFFGHPLSCEVALETLKEIERTEAPRLAVSTGERALIALRETFGASSEVSAVRGEGLMLAVEFGRPGRGAEAMDTLRRAGIIALASGPSGESLSFTPRLDIPPETLIQALHRAAELLI